MTTMKNGFTLLELLIAIVIVGILTATAIPQYSDYKKRAYDTRARRDLIQVAIAEEAYFFDSESYLSCQNSNCSILPGVSGLSDGVTLAINASAISFTGTATHPKGTGEIFNWDSELGGLQ